MENLEKRLQNTEHALLAMWNLIKETLPPEYQDDTDRLMEDYFTANDELGADFGVRNGTAIDFQKLSD